MALSKSDMESLKAGTKIAVLEAFQEHRRIDHDPIHARMNKINLKLAYWAGALAVLVAVANYLARQ